MPLSVDLTELLEEVIAARLAELHTAIPGTIKTYDAATQTAEVVVQVRAQTPKEDGSLQAEEAPVIPNVPVQWPRGGGFALHFPLAAGDHVLLVFSEAAIGHWRETGQLADPGDLRRHSLAYPIAIPGIAPNAGKLADAPAGEGVINVPADTVLRIGGAGSDFVALAAKVEAELEKIATTLGTGSNGSGSVVFATPYNPGSVGAEQLKAK
jgi:hypothetical protein